VEPSSPKQLPTVLAPFGKVCRVRRIIRGCEYIAERCICVPKKNGQEVAPYHYRTHAKPCGVNALQHMNQTDMQKFDWIV
jgi:hypothetical protein